MATCGTSNANGPAAEPGPPPATDLRPLDRSCDGDGLPDVDELVPIAALRALNIDTPALEPRGVRLPAVPAHVLIGATATVVAVGVLYAGLGLVMSRSRTEPEPPIAAAERSLPREAGRGRDRAYRDPRRSRPGARREPTAARPKWAGRTRRRPTADVAPATVARSTSVSASQISASCEFEPSCGAPEAGP